MPSGRERVHADAASRGIPIAMGAGEHGYSAWVEADDLISGFGAAVADISD